MARSLKKESDFFKFKFNASSSEDEKFETIVWTLCRVPSLVHLLLIVLII